MELKSDEIQLVGRWYESAGRTVADTMCQRIDDLISGSLTKITSDSSGWDILYQDPKDERYWELTYPESQWHGGGPPQLTHLSYDQAKKKYKLDHPKSQ